MKSTVTALLVIAACSKPAPSGTGSGTGSADPCSAAAMGLGSAVELTAWTIPAGCTLAATGTPAQIRDQAALDAALACPAGTAKPTLGTDTLVVVARSWSPAQSGLKAFDDGATVTLASMERVPCPDDPRPMPTPTITSVFRASSGDRTIAASGCSVKRACP